MKAGTTTTQQNRTTRMALIGLMTAILCVAAPVSLVLPFTPVPISLATLVLYYMLSLLDTKCCSLCILIYLLLGTVGLPVFSAFTGGIGCLLGPTGGFLFGYLLLVWIAGLIINKSGKTIVFRFIGMTLGTMACYLLGTVWLSAQSDISFIAAFSVAVIPFLPGDMIKLIIALWSGEQIRRRLQKAGLL